MLLALSIVFAVLGIALLFSAFAALVHARVLRFVLRSVLGLMLLVAGSLVALLSLGVQGMRALTNEESAAHIRIVPQGVQRYEATVTFADGHTARYELAGDEIYIDGHIVKWTPLAYMLGLSTSYRLDRIAGRYRTLEQEVTAPRTIYQIDTPPTIDLVALGRRLPLADFFDAEYGSATYVPVVEPAELELKVSTSGLLLRPVLPASTAPKG